MGCGKWDVGSGMLEVGIEEQNGNRSRRSEVGKKVTNT
jgi:hypothetical protein